MPVQRSGARDDLAMDVETETAVTEISRALAHLATRGVGYFVLIVKADPDLPSAVTQAICNIPPNELMAVLDVYKTRLKQAVTNGYTAAHRN